MPQTQPTASGAFGPVGFETGEPMRTDEAYDLENLSEEEQEVVTAEQFVIFGKANIEQWNDPGPGESNLYIEMDALEANIDQLLALENISRGHGDVRVGEPLAERTVEEDTTVHLDNDESLHFDSGDELRTEVIREGEPLPDGSGPAQEDALWLAANVFGRNDPRGSRKSQETRLGAYYGDFDGFSVTVDKLELTPTDDGIVVHDVDFLAVTIGDDQQIKNPGSQFGVVEYQMEMNDIFTGGYSTAADDAPTLFGGVATEAAASGAEDAAGFNAVDATMTGFLNRLFSSSTEGLATQAIRTAHENELELQEAASKVVDDDTDVGPIVEQAQAKLTDMADQLEEEQADREELAAQFADEFGMDKEEVHQMFKELDRVRSQEYDDGDGDDDDDDDGTETQGPGGSGSGSGGVSEEDLEEQLEEMRVLTEDDLDENGIVTQSDLDERFDNITEQLESLGEDLGENIEDYVTEQMEVGETPAPDSSNVTDGIDLKNEAEEWAGSSSTEDN